MNEFKLKEEICEIGRRVYAKGFAAANDGNISIRLNDREVLCTPTMVSKGFLKPEQLCVVDYEGKQLAARPGGPVKSCCTWPFTRTIRRSMPWSIAIRRTPRLSRSPGSRSPSAFCPKWKSSLARCRSPFMRRPASQKFADTIIPFVKKCNTIILANHGTVTFGPDLEKAYWNSEIIDSYCRILILARQLGRVNYFTEQQTKELLALKKRLGYDDPRFEADGNCDLCGNNIIQRGYRNYEPEAEAFGREDVTCATKAAPSTNGHAKAPLDTDALVRTITEQVMAALAGAR